MRLRVTGNYRSDIGRFSAGQYIDVADGVGEFLLRDSPGSFQRDGETVAEAAEEPSIGAMSTETASGLVVPDRRARGGRIR